MLETKLRVGFTKLSVIVCILVRLEGILRLDLLMLKIIYTKIVTCHNVGWASVAQWTKRPIYKTPLGSITHSELV